jgi:mono/diheme cytochrome c family protein
MRAIGLVAISAFVLLSAAAFAETPVERGSYLVNTVLTCGNCHSPKGPPQAIAGKDFSGGLSFDEPPFKVTAPNITQDKATGIGNYTDAQLKTVLRKGVKPSGIPVAMVMPSGFYEIMTERDLNAVVAYLRTNKPVSNKVEDPIYKMPQGHPIPPSADKPYTEAMLTDKVKKGFYLATIAHCMECHTPFGERGRDFGNRFGAGGAEFPGPWGVVHSRNITSSKAKGLGDWSDAEIKRAITQGIRKDGSKLTGPMGFEYYAKMTPADLDAIVAWLRTVPAKE